MFSNLNLLSPQGNGGAELKRIVMSSKIAGLMAGSVAFVNLFCSGIGQVFMCACAGVSFWEKAADFASKRKAAHGTWVGERSALLSREYFKRRLYVIVLCFHQILCKQSIAVGVNDEQLATCFPQTTYTCDTSVSKLPPSHLETFQFRRLLNVTFRVNTNKMWTKFWVEYKGASCHSWPLAKALTQWEQCRNKLA